jgi:enoyl-CoA hydratase/carnithine racemase
MSEHVRVEREGAVLNVTLDRPDRRNAITVAMYGALADAIGGAARDPAVRAIVLRGEGRDFAAGNDLADFLTALPRDMGEEIPVWRLLRVLAECETPLIAAAHGNCVGIGTTMLLHCDLVVAEEGARFSLPFVELGLVPEAASSLLLPDTIGRRQAARLLLLGETFGADEALALGIASHVAPAGALEDKVGEVVARLLAQPAEALRQTQQLLRMGRRDSLLERMRVESACFADRLQSDEVKQAIAAFFAARAARQSG